MMNIDLGTCARPEKPPNQGLDLTNPDAAQSVASAPLCLLSGLAAQAHVRAARREEGDLWLCENLGSMYPRCDCTRNAFLGDFGSLRRRRRVRGRSALPQCLSVLRTAAASRRPNPERSPAAPLDHRAAAASGQPTLECSSTRPSVLRTAAASRYRNLERSPTAPFDHRAPAVPGRRNLERFSTRLLGALNSCGFRAGLCASDPTREPGAGNPLAGFCLERGVKTPSLPVTIDRYCEVPNADRTFR